MSGRLVYPLPLDARIGTFDRMDWFHGRFLRSETVARAIAEKREAAAFYSVMLWSASFEQSPIGTIPDSEAGQMFLVGLGADVRRWRAVAPDALRGFQALEDRDGQVIEGRLGHPTMIDVAVEAWDRHRTHEMRKAQRRAEQSRKRLRDEAEKAGISREQIKGAMEADLWLAWLGTRNLTISARYLHECREAVVDGWRPLEGAEVVALHAHR